MIRKPIEDMGVISVNYKYKINISKKNNIIGPIYPPDPECMIPYA